MYPNLTACGQSLGRRSCSSAATRLVSRKAGPFPYPPSVEYSQPHLTLDPNYTLTIHLLEQSRCTQCCGDFSIIFVPPEHCYPCDNKPTRRAQDSKNNNKRRSQLRSRVRAPEAKPVQGNHIDLD